MNRAFKGIWIPSSVWLSKDLTIQEKVFIAEIDSLDQGSGCFASNGYLADFFGLCKTRVSQIINSLIDKGYVRANFDKDSNRKLFLIRQFPDVQEAEPERATEDGVVLPFESDEFKIIWGAWCQLWEKQHRKSYHPFSRQNLLKELSQHSEENVIDLLNKAVKEQWYNIRLRDDEFTRKAKNGVDYAGIGKAVDAIFGSPR